MSARPFPLPRHQAAKRTGLVRIWAAAHGAWRIGISAATAKRPSGQTASAGRCPSSPQTTDPSPPAPGGAPKPPIPRSRHLPGRGQRPHRRDADYSADKAASLGPPQLSNCKRHAATSERSPCCPDRGLSSLLRPQRRSALGSYPSQHPPLAAKPAPCTQFSLPFPSLPPPPSSLDGVRFLQSPSYGDNPGATSHSTPPLSAAVAHAQDRAPSFLQPSSLVPAPTPTKK